MIVEVEILRKLNHPNIIKLYDVYEDHSFVHIVTEAYFGQTLTKRLIEKPECRFSLHDSLEIIRNILKGLEYLHSQNIMHRDMKPDNIMFKESDGSYDLAIIDFGFATSASKYKDLFTVCGTKGYAAPEVLLRKPYGLKSDIFGAGVIFYQM